MKKVFWMACAFSFLAAPVFADGFYVAGDVGRIKWASDSSSTSDSTFRLAGGYKFDIPFHDTLALEVSYRDLGGANWNNGLTVNKVDITAMQFSVVSSHPVSDSISLYGRLGYADLEMEATSVGDGSTTTSNDKVFGGVGGHYAFNQKFGLYLEYDRYAKVGAVSLTTVSLGADFQF
jgi:hypothetical protein